MDLPPHRPAPDPSRPRLTAFACAALGVAGLLAGGLAGCDDIAQPAKVGVDTSADTVGETQATDIDGRLDRADALLAEGDTVNANSVLGELRPMMAGTDAARQARYDDAVRRAGGAMPAYPGGPPNGSPSAPDPVPDLPPAGAAGTSLDASPARRAADGTGVGPDDANAGPFWMRITAPQGVSVQTEFRADVTEGTKMAGPIGGDGIRPGDYVGTRTFLVRVSEGVKPVMSSAPDYVPEDDEIVFTVPSNVRMVSTGPAPGNGQRAAVVVVPPGTMIDTIERTVVGPQ